MLNLLTATTSTPLTDFLNSEPITLLLAGILTFLPIIIILGILRGIFEFFIPFYIRSMKKSQKQLAEFMQKTYFVQQSNSSALRDIADIEKEKLKTEKQRLEIEKQKLEFEKTRLELERIRFTSPTTTDKN